MHASTKNLCVYGRACVGVHMLACLCVCLYAFGAFFFFFTVMSQIYNWLFRDYTGGKGGGKILLCHSAILFVKKNESESHYR